MDPMILIALIALLAFIEAQAAFIFAILAHKRLKAQETATFVPTEEEREELELIEAIKRERLKDTARPSKSKVRYDDLKNTYKELMQ